MRRTVKTFLSNLRKATPAFKNDNISTVLNNHVFSTKSIRYKDELADLKKMIFAKIMTARRLIERKMFQVFLKDDIPWTAIVLPEKCVVSTKKFLMERWIIKHVL